MSNESEPDYSADPLSDPPGPPDLSLGGLAIWILGRPFEDSTDGWSEDFFNVTARFRSVGGLVSVTGDILRSPEIRSFKSDLEKAYKTLQGEVVLDCLEPYLHVLLKFEDLGRIEATVEITPDYLNEHHTFQFNIDQSYLPALIRDCDRILERYPLRRPSQA